MHVWGAVVACHSPQAHERNYQTNATRCVTDHFGRRVVLLRTRNIPSTYGSRGKPQLKRSWLRSTLYDKRKHPVPKMLPRVEERKYNSAQFEYLSLVICEDQTWEVLWQQDGYVCLRAQGAQAPRPIRLVRTSALRQQSSWAVSA